MFDPTQITEAQLVLYRRWFDMLDLPDDHLLRRHIAAGLSVEPNVLLAAAHPEIEYQEHRQLWTEGGGHEQLEANSRSLDLVDHVVVPSVFRFSDNAVLMHQDKFGPSGDASSCFVVLSFCDGLFITYDAYDSDDFDAALARYEEVEDGERV